MEKRILIPGIAVLLICVVFSGCFGNNENGNISDRFVGNWTSATLLNQKDTTFYPNGTGLTKDGYFDWEIINEQLIMYWPDSNITITYNYEFLNTQQHGEVLILTNVDTGQVDDYKRL